jgi:nitrous oxide reductase
MNEMDRRKFLELAALTSAAAFVGALQACASTPRIAQTSASARDGLDPAALDRLHTLIAGYVQRVARAYFPDDKKNVGVLLPRP